MVHNHTKLMQSVYLQDYVGNSRVLYLANHNILMADTDLTCLNYLCQHQPK